MNPFFVDAKLPMIRNIQIKGSFGSGRARSSFLNFYELIFNLMLFMHYSKFSENEGIILESTGKSKENAKAKKKNT